MYFGKVLIGKPPPKRFVINVVATSGQSLSFRMQLATGETAQIDWGDGYVQDITATGDAYQTFTRTLADDISKVTVIYADRLTYFGWTLTTHSINFSLSDLPADLTTIYITGSNTISGDIADAPAGLSTIIISGSNTISGDLANAPADLTYLYIYGSNTISGDIADAPAGLTDIRIYGSNTISGDIADAPADLTYIYIYGSNTISGDIADAPADLTYIRITGNNTISGDIADAPAGLSTIIISGSNTISGDLADAPADLTYIRIYGNNTISDYTSGRTWESGVTYMLCLPATGYGLSSTEVDNLLIDLDTSGMSSGTITINGNNAARTSASDAAVASLELAGVEVNVNET